MYDIYFYQILFTTKLNLSRLFAKMLFYIKYCHLHIHLLTAIKDMSCICLNMCWNLFLHILIRMQ